VTASTGKIDRPRPRHAAGSGGGRLIAPEALFVVLVAFFIVAVLLGVGVGTFSISPGASIAILLDRAHLLGAVQSALGFIGIDWQAAFTQQESAVLWAIRLPRVLQAALVGGGLAIAGAALQGIFRNPLADPGIIGVSAGASLGAVAAIVSGITIFGRFTTPALAFAVGVLTTMLVFSMSRHNGKTEVVTLILTGVAINAIAGALVGLIITVADDAELRSITFWSLGSVGGATWQSVGAMAPFALLGFILLPRWGSALNLFVLGESNARHLGVDTEKIRIGVLLLSAAVVGSSVAFAGTISFIGLVVPHAIRLAVGPDHRILLPASALGGAALLMVTDLGARTIAAPIEIPLGVITALIGGPAFLFLLDRTRRQVGGWG
jgi:iron complex transport system permease protein